MRARAPLSTWPSLALVAAVALLVAAPLRVDGFLLNPWTVARASLPAFAVAVTLGLLLRALLHRRAEGRWPRPGSRRVGREAARLLFALATLLALVAVYCWGKLLVPWFREATHDEALYAVELALHFGLEPMELLHEALAGRPAADAFLDWTYARYPLVLLATAGWFLSEPDPDERHRWLRGFVLLWLGGLALYWLLPALGPVFVFPDLGALLSERYPLAYATEAALFENHRNLLALLAGESSLPLRLEFGIAAFPSLHVALPAHAYFFTAERRSRLRFVFLAVTLLFLAGSVATGWHYLVDGWAGIALAALCWAALRRPRRGEPAQPESAAS